MEDASQLCKKISDITALLALTFDRAPVLEENDEAHTATVDDVDPASAALTESDIAIDDNEGINEAEFEKEPVSEEASLDALKRRALDRLSEVLARYKAAQGPGTSGNGNLSAKHVASVVMMEDTSAGCVTLFCSKNEGLDNVDTEFLADLKELLEGIAKDERESFPPCSF